VSTSPSIVCYSLVYKHQKVCQVRSVARLMHVEVEVVVEGVVPVDAVEVVVPVVGDVVVVGSSRHCRWR
jgi:hypothetical protein